MRAPKEIWLIHDPLDGPHLFKTKQQAWDIYRQWEKEAGDEMCDSFWDMTTPKRYVLAPLKNYPKETKGSKIAKKVRQECNSLKRKEREDLYEAAKKIIKPKVDHTRKEK